jgi:L-malate glycosyltransferase
MRICILTTSYPRFEGDDAGIFVQRLVEAYSACGAKGWVAVPLDRDEPMQEQAGGFLVQRFKYGVWNRGSLAFGAGIMPNLRAMPLRILQAPALLLGFVWCSVAARDSDVLHANWLFAGVSAWIAHLITKKPYVITVRGEDMRLLQNKALRLLFYLPLKQAAAVVSVNARFLADLRKAYRISKEKLRHIPNGVEMAEPDLALLPEFAEARGLDPSGKYIIFVGTLIPRKRIELLIEFIARAGMSEYALILCGRTEDGPYLQKLQTLADRLGCRRRLCIQGQIPPQEVPYYLALSRFYLSASEFEGRPNSLLEAFAARRLVFASDIEAHREMIEEGRTGFLFDPARLDLLEERLLALERDRAPADAVTERAYRTAQELSWNKSAETYLALFKKKAAGR